MVKALLRTALGALGYEISNKQRHPVLHFETDRSFHDVYERAQDRTQMRSSDTSLRRQRHFTLMHLLRAAPLDLGAACELGCWRGLSAYQIATHLQSLGGRREFHIFDSFAGLSELKPEDLPVGISIDVEALRQQFACSQENVQANLAEFSFIQYHKGWIPTRFADVEQTKFAFVHVDVDLYEPIADTIRFFYPRMVDGGIMVFDDYGFVQFPGARQAIDECRAEMGNHFFLPLTSGQAFALKGRGTVSESRT